MTLTQMQVRRFAIRTNKMQSDRSEKGVLEKSK